MRADTDGILIDSLAFGGYGVGRRADGKVLLVHGAAPGDRVTVRVIEDKARVAFAAIDRLVQAAPERIAPRCPVADRCGGCCWQHLPVDVQRAWKRRLVEAEMARRGLPTEGVLAPITGGAAFGHRTRTRLHLRAGRLGTMPRRSHQVLPLGVCPVLAAPLERFALDLAARVSGEPRLSADVELYVDADGRRGLAVDPAGAGLPGPWARIAADLDATGGELHEASGDLRLAFAPGVFVQTSREGNALLVAAALEAVGEGESFAEVYAGVGNFTVHLAGRFTTGSAAEGSAEAVRWLRRNLRPSPHVGARCEPDVASAARLAADPPADLLFVDPPRAGMRALAPLFEARGPRRVVLVSCHPMAALRDLEHLVARGYRLQRLVPIDLFPQTDHLELVATLQRTI